MNALVCDRWSTATTLAAVWKPALWFAILSVLVPATATAGGGPENLILVVNSRSAASRMLANYYIAGRAIPSRNVIHLADVPDTEEMTLDEFRDLILRPVLTAIERRGLVATADYIVYSADFPTAVRIEPHTKKLLAQIEELELEVDPRLFRPVASINSLTYFAAAVMLDQPGYLSMTANQYYRVPATRLLRQPFTGPLQKRFESAIQQMESEDGATLTQVEATLLSIQADHPQQLAVAYQLARVCGKRGAADRAARWLTRSVQLGWQYQTATHADRAFEAVFDDALFAGIVERIPDEPFDHVPTLGFSARRRYGPNGMVNGQDDQGNRHFLSTVLAVTRNFGNTERQALTQLRRSIRADATRPRGCFYFTDTSDIRSRTRQPEFETAVATLRRLGHLAEQVEDVLPQSADRVLGVTTGTASFDWPASGSRLVPGAIADNLTSFGGRMGAAGQTKLTEFLAQGAAGASGTVVEPYAVAAKFPHPLIHAHYARGCSLAEAFYQSVHSPSQLLIVGDALCRPFANPPQLRVEGLVDDQTIEGKLRLVLGGDESPVPIASVELHVDGRRVHQQPHLEPLEIDTNGLADGYHELRLVAVARGLIETRQGQVFDVRLDNHGHTVTLETESERWNLKDEVALTAQSNWGDSIALYHQGRCLARQPGREVRFSIPAGHLGRGPVSVTAVALAESADDKPLAADPPSPARDVSSQPLEIFIEGSVSDRRDRTGRPRPRPAP